MSDKCLSIGSLLSYNDGARMIIPNVPRRHAAVKIQRKKRSRTIAMNFQSSMICRNNKENNRLSIPKGQLNVKQDKISCIAFHDAR